MSTVENVIDNIRLNLSDTAESRWTDANLLSLVKKSIERTNHILMENNIQFAKADVHTFSTASGTSLYNLPSTFMTPADGLFRRDWKLPLDFYTDEQWEREQSTAATTRWRINGSQIEIGGEPDAVVSMAFYYWPLIDTSSYATTTTMPWAGKMDTPIEEYVIIRCLNMDEVDVAVDAQLLKDITLTYLGNYSTSTPKVNQVAGYYSYEVLDG